MPNTTIAVVTALSPSPTTLAEYGFHLLTALGRKPGVRIVALVEDGDFDYPAIDGVEIRKAWKFGSLTNPVRIARAAHAASADVVLMNAHFTSFGSSKVSAALGLLSPAVMRLSGIPVITLMHNIMETVDLSAAGFKSSALGEKIVRAIGTVLTWFVLRSNLVTTTLPRYVEILRSKYGVSNVALTPHGAFDGEPVTELENHDGAAPEIVMTFGKFGTYKKVEQLIEAVRSLKRPGLVLTIAGTDSPNTPGYLADVEARLGGPDVKFLGYIAEEDVAGVFTEATVAVFPYTATTGSSGVLHQAGSFGCPPILPRIGDLEDLVVEEGYTGGFFEPGSVEDLAMAIERLLDDADERARISAINRAASRGLSLEEVADWYLLHASTLAHGDALTIFRSASAVDSAKDAKLHKVL
ncbi:glycosyltransferase [Salinibacterium sp. SWN1162]|uniref:glycosyltransferase n=1 Tax=Salinibacterium sp. SWN1162 TaxID=2792053 RepID=UPI0018CCD556|nr:glycosyltransferase [Salinibacterium sp. SWN1162]MBH0009616.1 glycosyltransferase [Salinibacterium sp. SWN1162]